MLKERLGSHDEAVGVVGNRSYYVKWPMRNFKAQPAKTTPAKPARIARQGTLTIKEAKND